MKKIGNLEISFKNYSDNIYYYDVEVRIGNETRKIVLPRYHTFLGWIEVFGLPPQNEWVVLDNFDSFSKKAILQIDDQKIEEVVEYVPGNNTHSITTTRNNGAAKELCVWTQNYENAPESITSNISFEHTDGSYRTDWKTSVLSDTTTLTPEELTYVKNIESKYGKPDILLKKVFEATGVLPSIYYSLFPIHEIVDLSQTSGTVIEVGYLVNNSAYKVDTVHGDWFKRFDFGDTQLFIKETNYSSCDQKTENGIERIKNTYRKELFIA